MSSGYAPLLGLILADAMPGIFFALPTNTCTLSQSDAWMNSWDLAQLSKVCHRHNVHLMWQAWQCMRCSMAPDSKLLKSLHSFMKIAFIDGWFNCKVKDLPGCETSNASTYISTEFQSTVQGEEEIIVTFRKYTQCTNNISKEQLCYHFNSVSCRCAWTVPLAIPYLMILILKLLLFLCLQNGDARNRCFIYCDDQMHVFEQQSLRDKRQVPSTCHATAFCASHHHLLSHSSLQELDSQCIWCIQCHQWSSPRKLYMLTCAKPEYNCWSSPLCLAILSEPRTRSRTLCEMFASACSNSSSVLATFATAAK